MTVVRLHVGDAPFCHVNVFTSHVNAGFFHWLRISSPQPPSLRKRFAQPERSKSRQCFLGHLSGTGALPGEGPHQSRHRNWWGIWLGGSRLGVDFDATSLWVETPTSALRFERNARIVNPEMRCLCPPQRGMPDGLQRLLVPRRIFVARSVFPRLRRLTWVASGRVVWQA
jgi:hypothetical protein